jgi:hypothetical protein
LVDPVEIQHRYNDLPWSFAMSTACIRDATRRLIDAMFITPTK